MLPRCQHLVIFCVHIRSFRLHHRGPAPSPTPKTPSHTACARSIGHQALREITYSREMSRAISGNYPRFVIHSVTSWALRFQNALVCCRDVCSDVLWAHITLQATQHRAGTAHCDKHSPYERASAVEQTARRDKGPLLFLVPSCSLGRSRYTIIVTQHSQCLHHRPTHRSLHSSLMCIARLIQADHSADDAVLIGEHPVMTQNHVCSVHQAAHRALYRYHALISALCVLLCCLGY